MKETTRMNNQFLLNEIQNFKNEILEKIDPLIELKNGEIYKKRLSEAVKDSWERINDIQSKQEQHAQMLKRIDDRTMILEEIEKIVKDYQSLKSRTSKYIKPIIKGTIKIIIFASLIYLLLKGGDQIYYIFYNLLKLI